MIADDSDSRVKRSTPCCLRWAQKYRVVHQRFREWRVGFKRLSALGLVRSQRDGALARARVLHVLRCSWTGERGLAYS